jgi:hypothetical protein
MSQYTDRSYETRYRQTRARAAASRPKPVGDVYDSSTWLVVTEGRTTLFVQPVGGGAAEEVPGCCPTPIVSCTDTPLVITRSNIYTPSPPYDASYNYAYDISWNAIPGATSYSVEVYVGSGDAIITGPTSATLLFSIFSSEYAAIVTANGPCPASGTILLPQPIL